MKRFEHLIRKRKFDEADQFAKRFKLDREQVLKSKVTSLLEDCANLNLALKNLSEIQVIFNHQASSINSKNWNVQTLFFS